MACSGCATSSADGEVKGCQGSCGSGGCNKMNAFDWLSNMGITPAETAFDIIEVRFKGGRKDFYRNQLGLDLVTGDAVIVDIPSSGFHLGFVALQGELVRLQMKKKKVKDNDIPDVLRIASPQEIQKYEELRNTDISTLFRTRQVVNECKLDMKISDVEYQADGTKATFYYTAEGRVDFRELIKMLAREFRVRVEMRQISLRQEAGRIGGIGSCGRELCCSSWMGEFKSVSTSAARYQNLSLNPAKLSGQCGRLKCCLNFELDTYMKALRSLPRVEKPIRTEKGHAFLQKTDIFRGLMWMSYAGETTWHKLTAERVKLLQEMNAEGKKAVALTEEEEEALKAPDDALPINYDLRKLDEKYASSGSKSGSRSSGSRSSGRHTRTDGRSSSRPSANRQRTDTAAQNRKAGDATEPRTGRTRKGRRDVSDDTRTAGPSNQNTTEQPQANQTKRSNRPASKSPADSREQRPTEGQKPRRSFKTRGRNPSDNPSSPTSSADKKTDGRKPRQNKGNADSREDGNKE